MTETLRFARIGKQDLRLGTGKFLVTLADGREITMDEVDLGAILNDPTLYTPITGVTRISIAGEIVSVKYFGAKGDGSTDDSKALQDAFNSARMIYIPPSDTDYFFESELLIRLQTIIFGAGPYSRLRHTGTGVGLRMALGSSPTQPAKILLHNFKLVTDNKGNVGIWIEDGVDFRLDSVDVMSVNTDPTLGLGFRSAGIQVGKTAGGASLDTVGIRNSTIQGNGSGVHYLTGNSCGGHYFGRNHIVYNTVNPGLWIEGITFVTLTISDANEINFNGICNILMDGNTNIDGLTLHGNYIGQLKPGLDAIIHQGTGTISGASIQGNILTNDGGSSTARALKFASTAGGSPYFGINFTGNFIHGFGELTNPAIDFGGKRVDDSAFWPNAFHTGTVNIPYGNLPASTSVGLLVTRKTGVTAAVSDGGTVTHGLLVTPTEVRVTGSVGGEFVSVTAISSTTFTVAIKKHDGTAGTAQTIYWETIR